MKAKLIQVIETSSIRGTGKDDSPLNVSNVTLYFDGKPIDATHLSTELRQEYKFYGQMIGYSKSLKQFQIKLTKQIYLYLKDNILKE